jgi:tetratricopeptide (TPR) repeat protein
MKIPLSLILAAVVGCNACCAWSECVPPSSIAVQLKTRHDADIYAELGSWFGDRHEYACAAEALKRAVAINPASAHFNYLLGLSLYSQGRAAEAIEPLRQSIQIDPGAADAYLTLGAVFDRMGNRADAEAQWRQAITIDPQSVVALDNLSRDLLADANYSAVIALFKPMAASGNLTDSLLVSLSVAYSKSGLLDDASELLRGALRKNPSSVPLIEALAGVLILEMRVEEVTALAKRTAEQFPHDLSVQVLYLRTLVLAGDDAKAEALSRTLLASNPHNWEVLSLTGFLKLQSGDNIAARKYLEQSVALKPDDPTSRFDLGVALARTKASSAAKEQLQKAIALGYGKPEVHFELAQVLQSLGDTTGSQDQMQLYRRSLQAQSNQTQAAGQAALADQALAAGNLQQAIDLYRNAAKIDPDEPLIAYKLAMALNKSGDLAGERTVLEHAIQLNPRFALAQNQLGYLDSQDDATASAERHFRMAVEADPGYANAWMNLAATLFLESQWEQAKAAVNHVLALDPGNALAKALNEQLDAMTGKH